MSSLTKIFIDQGVPEDIQSEFVRAYIKFLGSNLFSEIEQQPDINSPEVAEKIAGFFKDNSENDIVNRVINTMKDKDTDDMMEKIGTVMLTIITHFKETNKVTKYNDDFDVTLALYLLRHEGFSENIVNKLYAVLDVPPRSLLPNDFVVTMGEFYIEGLKHPNLANAINSIGAYFETLAEDEETQSDSASKSGSGSQVDASGSQESELQEEKSILPVVTMKE